MTTDQKIREAYEKYKARTIFPESVCEEDFRAGYLALLNSLKYDGYDYGSMYRLPEGYQLVPIEPTEVMIAAGRQLGDVSYGDIYKAMLSAARSE